MSEKGLRAAQQKMVARGVDQNAINVFSHYYRELEAGATGLIPEESIVPLTQVESLESAQVSPQQAREAIQKTVYIKLNGGLGTSMGLDDAKSLIPVRDGKTFLDIICEQVRSVRQEWDAKLPILFMNSFRTRESTLKALQSHPDMKVDGLAVDFLQNQEPKLTVGALEPVEWPADPTLEWCPPGHGDIYTALLGSGLLQKLLNAGYRYACTSNSDNLGGYPNPHIAGWFAASGAPYAAEVCARTPADRKGGHLARRKEDGQLILRDTAQTPKDQMHFFTDEHRHPYFHTNNLWFDLQVLADTLKERKAVLGLPLIRNKKNVDPTDPASPEVYQIETAMGAAIQSFAGATAILVGRERFLPVKTTADLALVRSDVYELTGDGRLVKNVQRLPLVELDPRYYKTIRAFEQRFPHGIPSLKHAELFSVEGDWTFGPEVVISGERRFGKEGSPGKVRR
ncbi:MAG: UTP--glucose-1-phosphate uridylyltransferase [Winkia neuii]|uniref:UTP--glucose-1-phosphate uridylyltransferase n=1 Tax=Winkia neuii TaxID=33007 RepID=A0A2I1IKI5_9ACTO|nr:UTP--glucose-1-phosphate uridylyltransferase [Winkia neuii]OFJ72713.1 UTP--glucose-1-phosphate uridylyltransferase [Actinomyces sp. HMSC064C12]OFK04930.1 UTP--glucose-1-phosphate uridylyltransferase [Actinomyces sp. HMSC072A03]OFT55236.1 UTP--glucose-1-phosphate uridylyltransferase [Actinomyces sp. HMSC06A08]KWZ72569.1 UTP--glucose-1-phosphate uridylyltransferase [Winkia neuii]MDK8099499.1 UTP--glucose-1-phosphate uridylyltransferase [Winkia neuii]